MKVSFIIISQNLLKVSWSERATATHKNTNHYLYITNFPNFLTSEKLATERKGFYLFFGINHQHCLHSHTEKSYLRPVQKHKITVCLNKRLFHLTFESLQWFRADTACFPIAFCKVKELPFISEVKLDRKRRGLD